MSYDQAIKSCSRDVGNATRTHDAVTVRRHASRCTPDGIAATVLEEAAAEIESKIIQVGV